MLFRSRAPIPKNILVESEYIKGPSYEPTFSKVNIDIPDIIKGDKYNEVENEDEDEGMSFGYKRKDRPSKIDTHHEIKRHKSDSFNCTGSSNIDTNSSIKNTEKSFDHPLYEKAIVDNSKTSFNIDATDMSKFLYKYIDTADIDKDKINIYTIKAVLKDG